MSVFRAYDISLRQARLNLLVAGSRRAVAFAKSLGHDLKIAGSTARGTVHPWSDLDLLWIPGEWIPGDTRTPWTLRYDILQSCELDVEITILTESEVYHRMRETYISGARALDEVPEIVDDLPDPEIALDRVAFSVGMFREEIETHERKNTKKADRTNLRSDEFEFVDTMMTSDLLRRVGRRSKTALTRLAVFQDGGQSKWLDTPDDEAALSSLLDRLTNPAKSPFRRPGVVPSEVAKILPRLLKAVDDEDEIENLVATDTPKVFSALRTWADWARAREEKPANSLAP